MPGTVSVLELRQDGDVAVVNIKQAGNKLVLKDIQTYLKKKIAPEVITTYNYGTKRITMIGITKGKESEVSQHQLPPPYEGAEIYGNLVVLMHSNKVTWDASPSFDAFPVTEYEIFYEKACAGELETDVVEEDDIADDVEDVEGEGDEDADDEGDDEAEADDEINVEAEAEVEEEEEAPRPRVSRRIQKIDPQQLQFNFKSTLLPETVSSIEGVLACKQRKQIFTVFTKLLSEHCSENDIADLERGIYNATLEYAKQRLVPLTWEHVTFEWMYNMISKRTVSNFNPSSYVANPHLIQRWKDGEFTLDQIGSWTPYELNPAHWKDLKDQQFRREKRILEGNLAMATDRFRCSQCKKKMCSYYELQTRSADEPMTIFISCLNCGKHWKQ